MLQPFLFARSGKTEHMDSSLERHGIAVDSVSPVEGSTLLAEAVTHLKTHTVRHLLDHHGVSVNLTNSLGDTVLHELAYRSLYFVDGDNPDTIRADTLELLNLLIDHGIDINAKDRFNNTPLHLACGNNNTNSARFLLDHGADIHAKNNHGETPLDRAVKSAQDSKTIKMILERHPEALAPIACRHVSLREFAQKKGWSDLTALVDRLALDKSRHHDRRAVDDTSLGI